MPLPGNLTAIQVTGDAYLTGAGSGLSGYFAFAPNVDLADATAPAVIRTAQVQQSVTGGVMVPVLLACTDNVDLSPSGWAWTITERLDGAKPRTWSFNLPSTAGTVINGVRTVDLAELTPLATPPTLVQYLLMANNLDDVADPATAFANIAQAATTNAPGVVQLAGGTTEFLRADGTWAVPASSGGGGITPPVGDIGGTAGNPTVISTHLTNPLPLNQGGTGAATAAAARTALGLGTAATSDTSAFDAAGAANAAQANAISAAASSAAGLYLPLSQLPLPVASGGTGQATQQAALTALAGPQTAGKFLRSDGTNTALAAIQAGDVPTLNQSTTGTAAGLSATLAIASGGTGQTSAQAAINALTGAQSAGKFLRSDGTNATLAAIQAGDVPTLNQSTTGTAAGLSSTLAIGSGGTGQTSQQAAINALTGAQTAGRYLRSDGTNATLAAIQAGDVPQLNQNTSGTAAGLSATLAVGSGGTGATTAIAARANLGEYVWDTPASRGLLEYNFPPQLATISNNLVSGSVYGTTIIAQGGNATSKVGVGVLSSAATPTSGQNLIAAYSISGTTATQIAITADLGTWGSQGFQSYAWSGGWTPTPGATYLFLIMSNATTPVHLAGLSTTAGFPPMYNAGLSNTASPWFRVFLYGTGQTGLPASFTISAATMASTNAQSPWLCLL